MRYKKLTELFLIVFILYVLPQSVPAQADGIRFTDVTAEFGIEFRHVNGESGKKYFIEPLGSGVALFDFDNDTDLDLYFVNGSDLPGSPSSIPPTNRLYRNDGDVFTDVTDKASVGDRGYGLGCCVGDYNNDGFTDLYVTNYGRNVLYRNNGDGTFTDVADAAGVDGDQFQ